MADEESSAARTSYWQQQIEAWLASGQSQKAYCKANDLNYHRFGYWRRKFREHDGDVRLERSKLRFCAGNHTVHRPRQAICRWSYPMALCCKG